MSGIFSFENGWTIRDTKFSFKNEIMKASAYSLSNGYMGNRGTLEEIDSGIKAVTGTVINGIYDTPDGDMARMEIVNIPNWTFIKVWVDDEPLDLEKGNILAFNRSLNLREPILYRELTWCSPKGKKVTIKSERIVNGYDIHNASIKWYLKAEDGCRIAVESGIDANVYNLRTDWHFKKTCSSHENDRLYFEATTFEKEDLIGIACKNEFNTSGKLEAVPVVVSEDLYIAHRCRIELKKDQAIELLKTSAIYTSNDTNEYVSFKCNLELDRMLDEGYEVLKGKHFKIWSEIWDEADITVEGDEKAQIALRFAVYHLVDSSPRHSQNISFPARSLSSQEHWGSVHWDNEIFIMPFFTYLFPEISRNMLVYRYKNLEGARRKAVRMGYKGAFYHWESQRITDDERTSNIVFKDRTGRPIRSYFWDMQIHISADIAYAVWQYYEATSDMEFIADYGAEIILEIARFNDSRIHYDVLDDKYIIVGVIGADEYRENVNNNAYTNYMVKESFAIAFKVMDLLKEKCPERYKEIVNKIKLQDEELGWWKRVYEKLYVPLPREGDLVIEEHDGFLNLAVCSLEELESKKAYKNEYIGGIGSLIERYQISKQADVVMMLYLLRDQFSEEVKRKNWLFYEPKTDHGSSLSAMGYALCAADAGMIEESYRLFKHTSMMDLDSSYFSGLFSNGIHPCAISGAWLTVVHGFCGITMKEDGVHWRKPYLPLHWNKIKFTLKWHGTPIRFEYDNGRFTASLTDKNKEIPFLINNKKEVLTSDNSITFEVCQCK